MGKIGDLWVRLGLKKTDFEKGMDSAKKKAVDTMKGIAGAVGLGLGAMETFNKIIEANEVNNDKWENTMRIMGNSVKEFFSALTSGDFSGFQNGLDGIARKARETAEALRQIDDAQTVFGLFSTKNRASFNEALVTIRDKNASPEAVAAAKKTIEDIIALQTEQSGVLAEKAINAARGIISQRGNINAADISEMDIQKMLSIAINRQGNIRSADLESRYQEYLNKYSELQNRYTVYSQGFQGQQYAVLDRNNPAYKQALAALNNQYYDANLYNALWNKTNGEDLKQLVSFLQSAYSARSEIAQMQRTYNRATQQGGNNESIVNLQPEIDRMAKVLALNLESEFERNSERLLPLGDIRGLAQVQEMPDLIPDDWLTRNREKIDQVIAEKERLLAAGQMLSDALTAGTTNALDELANAIAGVEGADAGSVVKALLTPLADAAIKAGMLILAQGVAVEAFKESLTSLNGPAAIAAGAALIAVGVAAKAGLAAIGSGSTAGTGSSSYSGGYGSTYTPALEPQELTIHVDGRISGSDIVLAADRTRKKMNR